MVGSSQGVLLPMLADRMRTRYCAVFTLLGFALGGCGGDVAEVLPDVAAPGSTEAAAPKVGATRLIVKFKQPVRDVRALAVMRTPADGERASAQAAIVALSRRLSTPLT